MSDRVKVTTRILAAFIVPFLAAAFYILYFRPTETGELFAWRIDAHMTSYLLASAYIGGAYFFIRTALEQRWHRIAVGFLPVTTFAALMLVATILHWSRFNHNVAFIVWVVLYATTPVLVPVAWLRNRRSAVGAREAHEPRLPLSVRILIFTAGAVVLTIGAALTVSPGSLIRVWPWPITDLTARVTGAMFALTGVFGITIPFDGRWSAARIALQSMGIALIFILVGVARAWGEVDTSRVTTWVFIVGMVALLAGVAILTSTEAAATAVARARVRRSRPDRE